MGTACQPVFCSSTPFLQSSLHSPPHQSSKADLHVPYLMKSLHGFPLPLRHQAAACLENRNPSDPLQIVTSSAWLTQTPALLAALFRDPLTVSLQPDPSSSPVPRPFLKPSKTWQTLVPPPLIKVLQGLAQKLLTLQPLTIIPSSVGVHTTYVGVCLLKRLSVCLFMRDRATERAQGGAGKEGQAGSVLSLETDTGLYPKTLRS